MHQLEYKHCAIEGQLLLGLVFPDIFSFLSIIVPLNVNTYYKRGGDQPKNGDWKLKMVLIFSVVTELEIICICVTHTGLRCLILPCVCSVYTSDT